ncbi:multicopper oxidase domain-containing protein [Cronobacter malonaticus]|nr:multicopper oxidase domain-containing protein [Cronobacter malonaticus]ELQ6069360.1 multicopper oxidase domain-containing protein [Cronobacter malonaticus]
MLLKTSRRTFLKGLTLSGVAGSLGVWSFNARSSLSLPVAASLQGTQFDLTIGETAVNITGSERQAKTINGGLPGPVLRWKEGDTITVDEFRIAVAETYDVIVEPQGEAYTIFAQSMDRTGYARGTLATREGLSAAVPPLDPRPLLTMEDMGMGGMGHDMAGMDHSQMGGMDNSGEMMSMDGADLPDSGTSSAPMDHSSMAGMDHSRMAGMPGMQSHPASETDNPLVDMQAMSVSPKLNDPGIGLRNNGRKVLTYADLKSRFEDPDGREPGRTIELHLTGHMEKFAWSFNGIKFSDAAPVLLKYGERLRITLINDTMMTHPIHLHGMWSDLEDENGNFMVRKHTIDVPPGTKRSYRVTADALGRWAYHCHLLYHMEMGMFREVRVEE